VGAPRIPHEELWKLVLTIPATGHREKQHMKPLSRIRNYDLHDKVIFYSYVVRFVCFVLFVYVYCCLFVFVLFVSR
jgi:hypothetical protein